MQKIFSEYIFLYFDWIMKMVYYSLNNLRETELFQPLLFK